MITIRLFNIVLFSVIILSACNSQEESITKPILNEFENEEITLKTAKKSPSFTFAGTDEKHYEFEGGSIYLLYNFSQERITDKLRALFAETEFPYSVRSLYKDQYIIIFIASDENSETEEKIESIFERLEDH